MTVTAPTGPVPATERTTPDAATGRVARVSGPLVEVRGLAGARLLDLVRVGEDRVSGEVIRVDGDLATVQVFEDTSGLRVDAPVESTGAPLSVELGPGLLGAVVDGTQRPLGVIRDEHGVYIPRGTDPDRLDRTRRWRFHPAVEVGDEVAPGDEVGHVMETERFRHRILVPPGVSGVVEHVVDGEATVTDPVVRVDGTDVTMLQHWPVRTPRPIRGQLPLTTPLLTGQRVLDALFPVARGGTGIVPGGFGTGKTVLEQSVAKHAAADVVVYIGCGERGNELTEVLEDFPRLVDPRTGGPLMERTVLVANTSNMPVAARESSIYVGMTIAEYFRDQGYDAVLLADSTSRWGEALREVASRLGEVPAEDGYPAYLATRLAAFYERAGAVTCLGSAERQGSVTVVGAVSPAGGDFSEPVTQNSLRVAGCFWALDARLARSRHFPAIDWNRSYSTYRLATWFDENVDARWSELVAWAVATLQEEGSLQEIVSLLGIDAVAPRQRITLRVGRMLREDFLQQDSFDDVDSSCPPDRQVAMLRVVAAAEQAMVAALDDGGDVARLVADPALDRVASMRGWHTGSDLPTLEAELVTGIRAALAADHAHPADDITTPKEHA
ncbi:MAG: V-type ATP synthase subunit A [Dermatophilaceae bacterium]